MLDPKSYEALKAIGGITGLLHGLGVDPSKGLNDEHGNTPLTRVKSAEAKGGINAPGDKSLRQNPSHNPGGQHLPAITLTEPDGGVAGVSPSPSTQSIHSGTATGKGDNFDNSKALNASIADRRHIYGENTLPARASKTLLQLMFAAMKDKVLILLAIAAVVSLALGFFQDFGTPRDPDDPPVDWVEGVAIMVAIAIVVIVGSVNDWQKERQFQALNDKKEERGVHVVRGGVELIIDIKQVVVGDIAILEPGEIVPCDGVFLSGHNVRCDESGATGESDAIRKVTWSEWTALRVKEKIGHSDTVDPHSELAHTDCFIISGSKVLEGVGRYVVVAVGQKSFNGRIMMALRGDAENTPLQLKLNNLAELIAKLGSAAGLILFTALMIRFFVQLGTGDPVRTASEKGIAFVNILIISVTVIVVAVPEGLPLAVTLALAFATKRMTSENLLVRVLGSCETMANASVVCTDKTGTLTQNVMSVVAGSIGIHAKFVRNIAEHEGRTNANEPGGGHSGSAPKLSRKHDKDFSLDQSELNSALSPQLQALFNESIAVNSTAFEDKDPMTGEVVFVGSKTETALLKFAEELGWRNYRETREELGSDDRVVQMLPFSSERKAMGVVIRMSDGRYRLHTKGASEILSKKCTRHVVVGRPEESSHEDGEVETREIDELAADNISRTIIFYANQMLRTISLCYRDMEQWPPSGARLTEAGEVAWEDLARDMTLIGITGIEDPLRPGVTEAVAKCHRAGVSVKMVTGDNVLTARSIASQCGIFTKGGIIMEGPVFRQLSQPDMIEIVPRLQVLARSSPEDKKILVETLKHIGEIVGVTGDGTNDGPALKTASVGFSMGIAGTEVAKEASDIILMDDNFASIVKAIIWGRCVNDAVRKFLQFQLSTNVTAVVITFVSAVASVEEESVLSAVQLLWINIIMDTFAALALATDPASEALLDRKPEKKTAPLFNTDMYKQILLQSLYQIAITLVFHFLGRQILGLEDTEHNSDVVQTMVFNTFVFAQIFNSVNSRRLDRKLNIFEGITRNYYFMGITLIEIAVQILIVFVGGAAFQVTRVDGEIWGISLGLGFVSIPLGALIRLLPNEPFEKVFKKLGMLGKPEQVLPMSTNDQEGWNGAISLVRDNLGTFANLRGGRVRSSSFVVKSRSARLSNDQGPLPISSLLTMAPTLIAGAVATQGYTQHGSLSDPTSNDPSKSSTALWEGKLQLHPDTSADDIAYKRFGGEQNKI
ncbi:Ca-transporting ATPase [Dendrothele bispora CBS 962.96]|uniref:Calcium-transporting ATPase n=1 Tax=Dendrothele bispora (strain CBS 962.96) TaxID=1314807 RepID=A0A4S8MK39_DENBC|nr:Ca-transporting ATPase [Dendrothele bispora CBS 962.96]